MEQNREVERKSQGILLVNMQYERNWIYLSLLSRKDVWQTLASAADWEGGWTEVNCYSGPRQPTSGAGTELGRPRNRVGNCIYGKCQPPPNFIISRNKILFPTAKALDRNVKIRFEMLALFLFLCFNGNLLCECVLSTPFWTKPTLVNWLLL